jgi:SAM-dependent methyltransferase
VTSRWPDFGHPSWFSPPDARRRFYWDRDAAAWLGGTEILDLRAGQLVADLGCGWGYLGHLLASQVAPGGRIDGFDLDAEQISKGRSRARESGRRSLRFTEDDACALEVDDDRYDRAICQMVLSHQSDPTRMLREMVRIVKPGGLVAAIEPHKLLDTLGVWCAPIEREGTRDYVDVSRCLRRGAEAVGAGRYQMAAQLPLLFADVGLTRTALWLNPTAVGCQPPYDDDDRLWAECLLSESPAADLAAYRPLFDAGGGKAEAWERAANSIAGRESARREGLVAGVWDDTSSLGLAVVVGRVV